METFDSSKPIIFYGAWKRSSYYADILAKSGIFPVCYVDRNPEKHHTEFLGSTILPIKEALDKYPNAYIYLMVRNESAVTLEALADELTCGGYVKHEQILNFIIHKKYKSCRFMRNELTTYSTVIFPCCYGTIRPTVKIDFDDYEKTIDNYLQMCSRVTAEINSNNCKYCVDCPMLCENYWIEDNSIHTIHIIDEGICNLECTYCVRRCKSGKLTDKVHPNHGLILKALEKRKLVYKHNLTIDISCDELSVHPNCDEIIDGLMEYAPYSTIMLFSNATVFSPKIAQMLAANSNSYLLCSMDSGTRDTFNKIKQRDLFNITVENLKKYARQNVNIELKYIILPGINDSIKEAEAFMELCEDINPFSINISREIESCIKSKIDLPDTAIAIVKWFLKHPGTKLGHPYTDNDLKRIYS